MDEQKYSTRQAVSLAAMFLIGHVLIMNNGAPAKTDVWISILLAYTATLPLALLAARLTNVFPGKNLYDLQFDLFGPFIGRITSLLYALFSLHIGSLVLRNFSGFMQFTSLLETPIYVMAIFIIVLCIYCVKAGINTLARYTAMALPVFLLIKVGVTLMSTTIWGNSERLPPILFNGFGPVFKSAVGFFSIPFAELLLFPFVLQPLKEHRKAKTIYILSSSITAAFLIMVYVRDMLVLGEYFTYSQYIPSYITVSLIDIANFFQRIEVAVGAVLFMGSFARIVIHLYIASLGLSKVLGMGDYRKFAAPVGFLMAALSLFAYPNMLANLAFAVNIYPYYQLPFRVVIPVVIWLMAEWKRRRLKKEGRLPEPPPAADETPVARQDGGVPQNPDGAPGGQPQPT